jgi:ankyrin repeat protein
MKATIISAVVLIVVAVSVFFVWRATDHRAELRNLLMRGDAKGLDELLTKHPSLANAKNVDGQGQGWTPLHAAAYMGDTEILKVLLAHHANTEARDKRGLTPLLWTTFGGKPQAAAALLSGGADINAKGRDGRTALEQAKITLNQEMINLLRERGAKE